MIFKKAGNYFYYALLDKELRSMEIKLQSTFMQFLLSKEPYLGFHFLSGISATNHFICCYFVILFWFRGR